MGPILGEPRSGGKLRSDPVELTHPWEPPYHPPVSLPRATGSTSVQPRSQRPGRLLGGLFLTLGLLAPASLGAAPAQVRDGRLLAPDGTWHGLEDLGLRTVHSVLPWAGLSPRGDFLAGGTVVTLAGPRLAVVRMEDGRAQRLPLLPDQARLQREPLPLVDRAGELIGAAWLAGERERGLAVRFASWNGVSWGPAVEVAPPGPGSQLALAATVTAEGTPLLVWSAFDGHDDEVLWAQRRGARWSPPQRLTDDNQVPDITPALHAGPRGSGVLAAWSRYREGQYQVMAAHFDGRRWSRPQPLGPPGSLFPSFEETEASSATELAAPSTWLLYRTARPRGWQVLELDPEGRALRGARVSAAGSERPRLEAEAGALRFEWPQPGAEKTLALRASWENRP